MSMPELAAPATTALKMRIEGMDCSACALKIENALKRLRGVSDVSVSYGIETLTLRLDQDRISLVAVEQQIRALGYEPKVGLEEGLQKTIGYFREKVDAGL